MGDACVGELKRQGVDTSLVQRKGERLGLYFLEPGANQRPSKVIYDRAYSAIAEASPDDVDWDKVFEGATWFHISGITPAISQSAADLSLEAVKKARAGGLTVSCDLNFRKKLWKYGKTAPEVMTDLMPYVDVAVGNEEDCQKSLGINADMKIESGRLEVEKYQELTEEGIGEIPESEPYRHHDAGEPFGGSQRLVGGPEQREGFFCFQTLRDSGYCRPGRNGGQFRGRFDLRAHQSGK